MKKTIDDVLKPINETFIEKLAGRLSSPLIMSFTISWCLWNYKFFIVLLSQNTASATFSLIEKFVFPNNWHLFFFGILAPSLSAIFYTFIYPFIHNKIYHYSIWHQIRDHNTGQKLSEKIVISESLAIEIQERNYALLEEIQKLRKEKIELEKEIDQAEKGRLLKIPYKLNDNEKTILEEMSQFSIPRRAEFIFPHLDISDADRHYALGELVERKFAIEDVDDEDNKTYEITHEGRKILKEQN